MSRFLLLASLGTRAKNSSHREDDERAFPLFVTLAREQFHLKNHGPTKGGATNKRVRLEAKELSSPFARKEMIWRKTLATL